MDDTSHTAMRSLETDGMLKLVEAHARACRHSPRQIADHHVAEGVRQRGHHSRGVCRDVGRIRGDKKIPTVQTNSKAIWGQFSDSKSQARVSLRTKGKS